MNLKELPPWMLQHLSEAATRRRLVQDAVDKLVMTRRIVDSPKKVRGYRYKGMYFSLGEDPEYPRDPEVTKAINEFDPWVVPLLVTWVFYAPGSSREVTFRRHGIGVCNPSPRFQSDDLKCFVPSGYDGLIPNKLILIWEGDKNPKYKDIPGEYKPWNWELYRTLKNSFIAHLDTKKLKKAVREEEAKENAEGLNRAKERARFQAELDAYATKKLEQMSEVELKEFALHGREMAKPSPKPFVILKRN